jgi:hypothetical protein
MGVESYLDCLTLFRKGEVSGLADQNYEVIVIGGGFYGCCIALFLRHSFIVVGAYFRGSRYPSKIACPNHYQSH